MANTGKKVQAVSKNREPPSAAELAQAIEAQRRRIHEIRAIVDAQAKLMHETYDFEVGEADLGHCCDVVRDLLDRTNATLGSITLELLKSRRAYAPMTLAHLIEAPRQELFRAWSVASAIANVLRARKSEEDTADVQTVLLTLVRMMDDVLEAVEPLTLGLPIPMP